MLLFDIDCLMHKLFLLSYVTLLCFYFHLRLLWFLETMSPLERRRKMNKMDIKVKKKKKKGYINIF